MMVLVIFRMNNDFIFEPFKSLIHDLDLIIISSITLFLLLQILFDHLLLFHHLLLKLLLQLFLFLLELYFHILDLFFILFDFLFMFIFVVSSFR